MIRMILNHSRKRRCTQIAALTTGFDSVKTFRTLQTHHAKSALPQQVCLSEVICRLLNLRKTKAAERAKQGLVRNVFTTCKVTAKRG